MTAENIPYLTRHGWVDSYSVGDGMFLLRYPGGTLRDRESYALEHRCDRGERGVVVQAPRLVNSVVWPVGIAPTVDRSIRCPDCDLHGFVTDGLWEPTG